MDISRELISFIYFVFSGIIGGIIFDLFRCKRKTFNTSNIIVYFEDIIFWVLIGGVILYTSYIASNGQVRVYMLFSMLMGAVVYFLTFGKLCYKLFYLVCRYIKRLIRIVIPKFKEDRNEAKIKKA